MIPNLCRYSCGEDQQSCSNCGMPLPRKHDVSSLPLDPLWIPFSAVKVSEEFLYFTLRLMTDDGQNERPSYQYYLGDIINVEAVVKQFFHVPLRVYVERCVATIAPDMNSIPNYVFIENNGCLIDARITGSSSKFMARTAENKLQFQLEAFRFQNVDSGMLYITCHLKATSTLRPIDAEHRACSSINGWKEASGQDAACGSCESGGFGGTGGNQGAGIAANPGQTAGRKIRDVSQRENNVFEWEGDVTLGPIPIGERKNRFHDNVMLLLNEDQLLAANHSGLFSGAFLDRNVSPCTVDTRLLHSGYTPAMVIKSTVVSLVALALLGSLCHAQWGGYKPQAPYQKPAPRQEPVKQQPQTPQQTKQTFESVTEDYLIYSFTLNYDPKPLADTLVVRTNKAAVIVECHYPRKHDVSSLPLDPLWIPFSAVKVSEEFLYFTLRLMTVNDGQNERPSYQYYLGDIINVEAVVKQFFHVPLRVYVERCVATIAPDMNSIPNYVFIENNGCLIDARITGSSSKFMARTAENKLQFQLEAFRFQNVDSGMLYITCHLKATSTLRPIDAEHRACSYINGWKEASGQDAACGSCESGGFGGTGGNQGAGIAANPGQTAGRKIRDVSQRENNVFEWEGDVTLGPIPIGERKNRFHDNVMLLLNEDQLLAANHSGLFSGAFLDRNVSPCLMSCSMGWLQAASTIPEASPRQEPVKQQPQTPQQTKQTFERPLTWGYPEDPTPDPEVEIPVAAATVAVECRESIAHVEAKKDLFGIGQFVNPADITLGNCAAVAEDNAAQVLIFETELQSCLSTLTVTEDYLIYSFTLNYDPKPLADTLVVRTNKAAVSEEFLYFTLRLMTDDGQNERPSYQYYLGDIINVEAVVKQFFHVPLRVYVERCVATIAPDMNSIPNYVFIENNGCLIDARITGSSSKFMARTAENKLQFQLEAFRFQNVDSGMLYITCHLKATSTLRPIDAEHRACSYING
ncbi:hypothetical protein F7725_004302 [Dissostichus mawsoni]|uniref:Zona pellucida sperm-binding protein 3 n=1 Tax=Dissostichus mawsoni TaxID=36200 RepID=A0A7J5XKY2_DISMA|nr:hypothetical protein F7725_004302 [Dissostichus mawsoni]